MLEDHSILLTQFVTLSAVLDPVTHLTLFVGSTDSLSHERRRRAALLSIPIAFVILTTFGLVGQYVLHAMGISLLSFQIAGGIIIFLFAVSMVLGDVQPRSPVPDGDQALSVAIHPLAVPILAGPGSMLTVLVLVDNNRFSIVDQLLTILALAAVLAILLVVFLASETISRILGQSGPDVLRRIMGLLLAALSVNLVLSAVSAWLRLPAI